MSCKEKMKDKIYQFGLKIINKKLPLDNWRNEYARLRWWFVCSNQYEETIKPWFNDMLQKYKGNLWNRGWLISFDYWLCWIFLGAEPDDYFDYELFRKNWRWRNYHITKQRLNFFDPIFNDATAANDINDKCSFYEKWSSFLNRKWCVPQHVTYEAFRKQFANCNRLLIKPVDAYGGKGIYDVFLTEENMYSIYETLHNAEGMTIAEEYIQQSGYLHDIHPQSLNTMRISTVMINGKAEVCSAFLRTGCGGSIVDNTSSGGIYFPIDLQTGVLGIGHGIRSNGHYKHPDTGITVTGQHIQQWDQLQNYVCDAHRLAPDNLRLIGWDVCWSDGNICLIEGNTTPGFSDAGKNENQWKRMKSYLDAVTQR